MKNNLARSVAILLVIVTVLVMSCALTSCSVDYTDEEVLSQCKLLIEKSFNVNEIFFGKGLEIDKNNSIYEEVYGATETTEIDEDDLDVSSVKYLVVSEDSGYTNLDQLKDLAKTVYSEEYCNIMFVSAFEGVKNDETSVKYARFMINLYDQLAQRSDVSTNGLELGTDFDYDSMEVVSKKAKECVISVKYTYTEINIDEDGIKTEEPIEMSLDIKMVNETMGWRLDTPTYYVASVTNSAEND